jgi:hypothetical protein
MRRRIQAILLVGLAVSMLSCTTTIEKDLVRRHVLTIDEEGRPLDPATNDKLGGQFRKYIQDLLENADDTNDAKQVDEAEADACSCATHRHPEGLPRKVRRILVHIHGGLNSHATSLAAAQESIGAMLDEKDPGNWHYPVFVTWPSGPISSYREHLFSLRQGRHAAFWGPVTSPVYFSRDMVGGVVNSTRSWLFQAGLDASLAVKVAFDADWPASWRDSTRIYDRIDEKRGEGEAPYDALLGAYSRGWHVQSGRFVSYWGLLPFKLLTSTLFLDGMGLAGWQVMLHRTENVLRRSREFEMREHEDGDDGDCGDDAEDIDVHLEQDATGALAIFLSALERHIQKQEELHREKFGQSTLCYQITLVGHSMGAIIINNVLSLFPDLPVTTIVYMAPACSIGETERAVVPFLKKHSTAKFHLLTLHPLAEGDEINAYDTVPRGSLLEWIDNFFSTPASHRQRRLGKWINIMPALHIFKEVRDQVSIKAFGVDRDSLPQKHGDFNLCPFWERSFWKTDGPLYYYPQKQGRPLPKA